MTGPSYNVVAAADGAALPLNPGQKATFVWESTAGATLTLQQTPLIPPKVQPKWWQRWRWAPEPDPVVWEPLAAIGKVFVGDPGAEWTQIDQVPAHKFEAIEPTQVLVTVGFDDMTGDNEMIRAVISAGALTAIIHDRQDETAAG